MKPSFTQQIARNSIAGLIGQIALRFISFAYTIAIVRQLGDEQFGEYSTALALIGILTILADLGMANYVVREVAKDRTIIPTILGNMMAIRIILGIIVFAVNVGMGYLLGYSPNIIFYIVLGSIGLCLYAIYGPLDAVLQGLERIDLSIKLNIVNQIIVIAVGSLLLWQGWGVIGVFGASYVAVIVTTVLAWRQLTKITTVAMVISRQRWPQLIWAGLPFAVTIFATMLSFRIDTVMLSLWRPQAEIGWYNAAYNLIFAFLSLAASFISALVPSLSRQYQQNAQSVEQFFLQTIKILWILSVPIAIGTTMKSEEIITLLYGREYIHASQVLQILIWVLPILNLTSLCGSITTVLHLEHATARINLINASFNIALNLLIIPYFGIIGAAITTVLTELVGLVQYTWLLHRQIALYRLVHPLTSTLLPAASLILVLWLSGQLYLLITIPLAALTYLSVMLLTGGLKPAEIQVIASTVITALRRRPLPVE